GSGSSVYLGGITGKSTGAISNCHSSVTFEEGSCATYIGGIAGYSQGSILDSVFSGIIDNIKVRSYCAGIVGYLTSDIKRCGNISYINCNGTVAGIVGYAGSSSTISLCYNTGNINGTGNNGGLIADNYAQVENCFSIGDISTSSTNACAGLIGNNMSNKYVTNCYCVGSINDNGNGDAFARGSSSNYSNCFFNKTKAGNINSSKAFGLADAEMKDTINYSTNYAFWDFNSTWGINKNINGGYPYLISMNQPVTGITISDTSAKIILGDTKKLEATVLPEVATNKNVIWSSSDENIVSVDDSGIITAKGLGLAVITVKSQEGGFSAQCSVTVITENETDETIILRLDDVSTIAGQRISVPLRLTKNTAGISTLGIDITYNNAILTPYSVNTDNCDIFTDLISNTRYSSDTIRITTSSVINRTGNGVICYLEFNVAENAAVGSSDIKINVNELKNLSGTTQKDLSYIVYNGKITVEDCILGDVNNDTFVTAADATEVLLNYAGLKDFSVRENTAGDVDKSGSITANDATWILLKYAGYDTEW
ncbi:Ig-like domain-containing protein, partial [bacterium]|nr:Ig-like domain-containing protein [bacterium]